MFNMVPQDVKEFKERMALLPLRFVDEQQLIDLAKAEDAVFVLSAGTEGVSQRDRISIAWLTSFKPSLIYPMREYVVVASNF